ncbi:replication factor A [Halococcus salsus]|uniref:replication factor A n=1 Tax=Halococcus salsus TaxID=2162894 RepID=UPI00135BF8FC|nr:replication factor A [Halococcus salsus]
MSAQSASGSIVDQFENNAGVEIEVDDVQARMHTLIDEYQVPEQEARRSVVNSLLDEHDIDQDAFYASDDGNELVQVGDIDEPEQWVDIEVVVDQLWEPNSDSMSQVGLVADESGRTKFISWEKSDLPELEEGQAYRLTNVVTDEYEGQFSVKLNRTTGIEAIDSEIDTNAANEDVVSEGAFVALRPGSGLIKRCPEEDCTRVLQDGECSAHGAVDGEFDLRMKAVFDDGQGIESVIFDAEATEALTGMTVDEATDMAMDALDQSVVVDELREQVLGRYYEVTGPVVGDYHLANEVSEIGPDDALEADAAHVFAEHFEA